MQVVDGDCRGDAVIRKMVIIGDAHAKDGVSNRRFDWLGNYIAEERPEEVISMGDWWDMPSLCSYDEGKACFEGRRYKKDIAAGVDALKRVDDKIKAVNVKRARNRRYAPNRRMVMGNHDEARISRAVQEDSKLEGVISLDDLRLSEFGWEATPFLQTLEVGGISFAHYFMSGIMGRAIGGETPALTLIKKKLRTTCSAHSHLFEMACRHDSTWRRVWGIIAGCYLDVDQHEDYAGQANHMWARGLLELEMVENGDFDSFRWLGVTEMQRKYA